MKYLKDLLSKVVFLILLLFFQSVFAQLEYKGLSDKKITSLSISSPFSETKILVAGTKGNGVYCNNLSLVIDSLNDNWANKGLNKKSIHSVFILNNSIGPADYSTLFAAVENDSLNKDGYLAWQKPLIYNGKWTAIDSTLRDSVNDIRDIAGFGCDKCYKAYSYNDLYCCTEKGIYKQNGSDWEKVLSQGGLGWISSDVRSHSLWTGGASIAMTPLLFTSDNYCDEWKECKFYGVGDAVCYGVAVDPNHPDTIYATVESFVLKSEDGGLSWKKAGFLGDICRSFIAVEVDPNNSEHVVVISKKELFESYNGGQSWYEPLRIHFKSQMVDMVSTILIDSIWTVFIATENDGVYSYRSSPVIGIGKKNKNTPDSFMLSQNYPNPFNGSTSFSYSLPYNDFINISVSTVSGKLVEVLYAGYKTAGSHKISWRPGSAVASGLYFYRLQTSEHVLHKKCLYIK